MADKKYICKAVPGQGWRIWNRRTNRWWGNYFKDFPSDLLVELNGEKRPSRLVEMCKPGYVFGKG